MVMGRPLKFPTPNLLQKKIDEYFSDKKNEPFTVCGLALFLGFVDRQSLLDYNKRDNFSCIIKRAKTKIENYLVQNSLQNKLNVVASIFNLKNNFGYVDKQEIKHDGTMVTVNVSKKESGV